jgi:uncharacterized protein with FMN-binding domain
MPRSVKALLATVAGLVLVLSFHTRPLARPPATAGLAQGSSGGRAPTEGPLTPGVASSGNGTKTVTGPAIFTRFGNVQVKVTVKNGRITGVAAAQLPFEHPRSQMISDYAAPILHDETIRAQNAQIDTVSGATYTSDGYRQSLQAALDNADG